MKQTSHGEGSPSNMNVKTPVLLLCLRIGTVVWGVQGREELGTFALSIYSFINSVPDYVIYMNSLFYSCLVIFREGGVVGAIILAFFRLLPGL